MLKYDNTKTQEINNTFKSKLVWNPKTDHLLEDSSQNTPTGSQSMWKVSPWGKVSTFLFKCMDLMEEGVPETLWRGQGGWLWAHAPPCGPRGTKAGSLQSSQREAPGLVCRYDHVVLCVTGIMSAEWWPSSPVLSIVPVVGELGVGRGSGLLIYGAHKVHVASIATFKAMVLKTF